MKEKEEKMKGISKHSKMEKEDKKVLEKKKIATAHKMMKKK